MIHPTFILNELLIFEIKNNKGREMSAEIVTCSKIVALHSLESRQPIATCAHHRGIINCASVNHTNKVVASCGQDGKIILVTPDKPESKLLQKNFYSNYKEKPSSLTTCAFSHQSRYIAVGSVDSVVKLWDLRGDKNADKDQNILQIKSHMCGVTSLAWVRNLRSELVGSQILASSSSSGEIFMHSNKSGSFQEVMALKLQEGINCIKVSESAEYCRMAACTNGGTLAVWDLLSGKDKPFWTTSANPETKATMTSLAFSTYSPVLLVTASVDETLTFFDIHDKKPVKKMSADQPLSCVGLHANGHTLVAGGMYGNCFVYDLRNPSKPQTKLAGHQTTVKHLQFFKSKQTFSGGDRSKAPSMINVNSSSSVGSSSSLEQKTQVVPTPPVVPPAPLSSAVQSQVRSKQNIKAPEPKTNNFINSMETKIGVVQNMSREKKLETKLSHTSQQMMKNPQSLRSQMVETGSEYFRPRARESRTQVYDAPRGAELREMKQKLSSLQKQLKNVHSDMFQMQQRLNMSMIRQFQLHQSEMKSLLQSFLTKEKQKDDYIKKLESENARLKSSTF